MTQEHDSFDSSLLEGVPEPSTNEPEAPVLEFDSPMSETEIGRKRNRIRRKVNRKPLQPWLHPDNPAIWEGSI
jgi:hypothetical protein